MLSGFEQIFESLHVEDDFLVVMLASVERVDGGNMRRALSDAFEIRWRLSSVSLCASPVFFVDVVRLYTCKKKEEREAKESKKSLSSLLLICCFANQIALTMRSLEQQS